MSYFNSPERSHKIQKLKYEDISENLAPKRCVTLDYRNKVSDSILMRLSERSKVKFIVAFVLYGFETSKTNITANLF